MVSAILKKDYIEYAKLTPEEIIVSSGGEAYFVENLANNRETLESSGIFLREAGIDSIAYIFESTSGTYALLTYWYVLQIGELYFEGKNYLLGRSAVPDIWTFVELDQYSEESIKQVLPNLPEEIEIPVAEMATLKRE